MFPYLFKIGSFQVRIYSLMIMIGVLIGLIALSKRAKSLGYDRNLFENAAIITFIGGIIGARIYYVIFNWHYFKRFYKEIPAVWHGGLAIHGGILFGVITLIIYCRLRKVKIITLMDMIAPFLLLGQGIGRFGNFANGEAHGVPTITPPSIIFQIKPIFTNFWNNVLVAFGVPNNPQSITNFYDKITATSLNVQFQGGNYLLKEYVPWGISFPNTYMPEAYRQFGSMPVHPTFFYEMILNFIGAAVLILLWRKDTNIGKGKITCLYFLFYGVIRAFVTFFRADDLMLGPVRAPHAASLSLLLLAFLIYIFIYRKETKN